MEEALVEGEMSFVADEETAEVAQMSKGALDLPAPAVATEGTPILQGYFASAPMGADQFDAPRCQSLAEALRVISTVADEPRWAGARTTTTGPWHLDSTQGFFGEDDFRRRGTLKSRLPKGIPWPSATTIHFVPLPRLVLPTQSPLFWPVRSSRP